MLKKATRFLKILTLYEHSYSSEHGKVSFPKNEGFRALKGHLDQIEIELSDGGARGFIQTSRLPFSFFQNLEELLSKVKLSLFQQGLVVIQNIEGQSLILDYSGFIIYNGSGKEIQHPSTRLLDFYFFVEVLSNEAKRSNEVNSFIDYFDEFGQEFIVIPKTNPTRINIPLVKPVDIDSLPSNSNEIVSTLQKSLNENTNPFRVFLKNQIYSNLKDVSSESRILQFLQNLREIVSSAQMDYELYCSEISIDQLKKDYEEYKTKYFDHLTDILSKISNQVIALPLTVLGASFAISRLSEAPWALTLIAMAILAVSGVVGYILYHYLLDLEDTERLIDKDYKILRNSEFFKTRESELSSFEQVKGSLLRKLRSTRKVMNFHFWIMVGFNEAIIAYTFHQSGFATDKIISFALITLLVPAVIFRIYFQKN